MSGCRPSGGERVVARPKLSVETSVLSYLVERPSGDLVVAARQKLTYEWWESKDAFELYVSGVVVQEARLGDKSAAARRLAAIDGLPSLRATDETTSLAVSLVEQGAVPATAPRDALHIALAAVHGMHFLLTWNFRHIANATKREAIQSAIEQAGFRPPVVLTPEDLLEASRL